MRSIIAGVISPVCRQETALSEGSVRLNGDSMEATWQVTPGTSGSTKAFTVMSLKVKIPSETSATSPLSQPASMSAAAAVTTPSFKALIWLPFCLCGQKFFELSQQGPHP